MQGRARCAALAVAPGRVMRHLLRLAFIVFTVLRYGLDELALSAFRQRWVRALVRLLTLGRRLDEPRGVRLRRALRAAGPHLRQVRPGAVDAARPAAADLADELARLQDRVPPFPARAIARGLVEKAFGRPLDRVSLPASRPSRWPARRSRRCTSRC
jgi:ubiquinone biosynthesis protein